MLSFSLHRWWDKFKEVMIYSKLQSKLGCMCNLLQSSHILSSSCISSLHLPRRLYIFVTYLFHFKNHFYIFLFVQPENPGFIQRVIWFSNPVSAQMFKTLSELEALSGRHRSVIRFDLLLFQMGKLKFREGGATVSCGGADTHISRVLLQWPSSIPYCPWCLHASSIKHEAWTKSCVIF